MQSALESSSVTFALFLSYYSIEVSMLFSVTVLQVAIYGLTHIPNIFYLLSSDKVKLELQTLFYEHNIE